MRDWTPEQWGLFFASLSLLITTAITPLVQIILTRGTNKKIKHGVEVSEHNAEKLSEVDKKIDTAAVVAKEASDKADQALHAVGAHILASDGEERGMDR